jgi:hypothetical protein
MINYIPEILLQRTVLSSYPAGDVTDLSLEITDGEIVTSGNGVRDSVRVIGEPLHEPAEDVVDTYRDFALDEFLASERRRSCGKYVVVDSGGVDRIDVITSIGYCGGYAASFQDVVYVSTLLRDVLSERRRDDVRIDVPALLRYFDRNQAYRTPFTTPFHDVFRLPGATHLTVTDEGIDSVDCYLNEAAAEPSPSSFDGMMDEITDGLDGRDVALLYSGGVDSTALAVAMMKNGIDFDSVTVDIGPGYKDAPIRARRVADELGFDTEIVEMAAPPEDEHTMDHLLESMRADLVAVRHPALALGPDTVDPGTLVLSGQNMDSLVMHNMGNPWYSTDSTEPTDIMMHLKNLFDHWVPNVQFTDAYIESGPFRGSYLGIVPLVYSLLRRRYPDAGPDYFLDEDTVSDPSYRGVLKGMMCHRIPNLVPERFERLPSRIYTEFEDELGDLLEREIDMFQERVTREEDNEALDLFEYYVYANNSTKQIATFPTPGGGAPHLPLSWGPATSFYVGRPNPLRQTLSPKLAVYEYVEEYAGTTHQDLVGPVDYSVGWKQTGSSLLSSHGHLLDPDTSIVCEMSAGEDSSFLADVYDHVRDLVTRNSFRSGSEMILPHRVLNVELLLRSSFDH